MQRVLRRLLKGLGLATAGGTGMLTIAAAVALWHKLETPQPLESALPGEARMYRWRRGHIFYKVLGPANAEPLVLLHAPGIGASAYEMRKIIRPLAERYRVYAPDLLGFGLSDRPPLAYSADTYIELLQDFLSEVVQRPAILLARGLSCNYAVAAAARKPELCTRLALLSPADLFSDEPRSRTLEVLARLPLLHSLIYPLLTTRLALRSIMRNGHEKSEEPEQISGEDLDYLYATTHQFGAEYAPLALFSGRLARDVSREYERLPQPRSLLWGALSFRPEGGRLRAPERTEVAVIDGAGARLQEENPEAVVAHVLAWQTPLAEVSQEAAPPEREAAAPPEEEAAPLTSDKAETPAVAEAEPLGTAEEQPTQAEGPAVVEAYCVRCKQRTVVQDAQEVTMKNGRPAIQGTCSVCGTRIYRIGRLS